MDQSTLTKTADHVVGPDIGLVEVLQALLDETAFSMVVSEEFVSQSARQTTRVDRTRSSGLSTSGHGRRTVHLRPCPPVSSETSAGESIYVSGWLVESAPCDGRSHGPLADIAHVICDFVEEVGAKAPGYFRNRPLRLAPSPDPDLPIAFTSTSTLALVLTDELGQRRVPTQIGPEFVLKIPDVLTALSAASGVELKWAPDQDLDELEQDLTRRLKAVWPAYGLDWRTDAGEPCSSDPLVTGTAVRRVEEHLTEVMTCRQTQHGKRKEAIARTKRQLEVSCCARDGLLATQQLGPGNPDVVILNAIGQNNTYWVPLMAELAAHHTVMLVNTLVGPEDEDPAGLDEHGAALVDLAQSEAWDGCHIVGWCTGAKLAMYLESAAPAAVATMTLINGSFKHPGRNAELDSPYERDLGGVFATLAKRPQLAGRLKDLFGGDAEALPVDCEPSQVLKSASPALAEALRQPFATEAELVRYARQTLKYWEQLGRTETSKCRTPTLLAWSSRDEIVNACGTMAVAPMFQRVAVHPLEGANHYPMFERPRDILEMVTRFWSSETMTNASRA